VELAGAGVAKAEGAETEVTGKGNGITTWSLHWLYFFHCRGQTEDNLYTVLFTILI